MTSFSVTEFRKKASKVFDLVEKGETVQLLRHGKAIAKIVPVETRKVTSAWKLTVSHIG
jgi:antitoxin (DNA-binding transcriptional repressor) of toxin-antitoxin stability system